MAVDGVVVGALAAAVGALAAAASAVDYRAHVVVVSTVRGSGAVLVGFACLVMSGCGSGGASPEEASRQATKLVRANGFPVQSCDLDIGAALGNVADAFALGRYVCTMEHPIKYGDFGSFVRWCFLANEVDGRDVPTAMSDSGVPAEQGCA